MKEYRFSDAQNSSGFYIRLHHEWSQAYYGGHGQSEYLQRKHALHITLHSLLLKERTPQDSRLQFPTRL